MKKYNAYDDTVIIYTSDHGDFMGDYGLVEKLQCLEESLMRVPLFVKPPIKDFEGVHIKDDVLNIDVAATCKQSGNISKSYDATSAALPVSLIKQDTIFSFSSSKTLTNF